ncbi:histidine phosphatase family protein [Treponema denticola]|uniref:histidine phosphatase family protein n=1 Tax=Treponema denticola TaxID=158 RepID=UPI0021F881E4|nr:histidine phosphatase family protein [Treponema denticola]UYT08135.1 histidine phosphatase family protein [Treponema denticola]
MKLFVVRHGETDWNSKMMACGVSEALLTEKGKNQAKELAERLAAEQDKNKISLIYVSPLKRAVATAAYIEKALGIKAKIDDRLKEINFGTFEGEDWRKPEFLKITDNPFFRFPQGETLVQTAHRAYGIIEEVKIKHKTENVLFVCHGMISTMICTYFRSYSQEELEKIEIKNCQLLQFEL